MLNRAAVVLCFFALPLFAAVEFNRDVRPILSDRCFSCHGPDRASRKSPLRLDQEASARPKAAEILKRITSTNQAQRMPPAYLGHDKLPRREIEADPPLDRAGRPLAAALVVHPAPASAAARGSRRGVAAQPHRPLRPARLEREGLTPSPEADTATLLRRVTLDLTGSAAHARGGGRLSAGRFAGRVREGGGPAARVAALRRAHGLPLAGSGALRRHQRLPDRRPARHVALARLGDRRLQPQLPFDRFTIEQWPATCCPTPRSSSASPPASTAITAPAAKAASSPKSIRVEYVADRARDHRHRLAGPDRRVAPAATITSTIPSRRRSSTGSSPIFNSVPDEKGFVWNFGNEDPLHQGAAARAHAEAGRARSPGRGRTKRAASTAAEAARRAAAWERSRDAAPDPTGRSAEAGTALGTDAGKAAGCERERCDWPASRPAQSLRRQALSRSRRQDRRLRLPAIPSPWRRGSARRRRTAPSCPASRIISKAGARPVPDGRQDPPAHHLPLDRPRDARGDRATRCS